MIYIRRTFDYDFIMHMSNDIPVVEIPDSIAEKITGDSLDNILNKFRTVTLDTTPVLLTIGTHIAYGFAAKLIYTHLRLHIRESTPRWEPYKQHPGYPFKGDTANR